MNRFLGVVFSVLLMASAAAAAGPKDYQVTGPVLDLTDDIITVEKGKEKWEIGRDKDTKVTGDLKKGSKVTVHYKMNATSVESKETGKATKGDKAKAETKGKGEVKTK